MRNLFEEDKMEGIAEGKDLRDKEIFTRCITVYGMTEKDAKGIIERPLNSEERLSKMILKRKP